MNAAGRQERRNEGRGQVSATGQMVPAAAGCDLHVQFHRSHDHRRGRRIDSPRPAPERSSAWHAGWTGLLHLLCRARHPAGAAGRTLQPGSDHRRGDHALVADDRVVRRGGELRSAAALPHGCRHRRSGLHASARVDDFRPVRCRAARGRLFADRDRRTAGRRHRRNCRRRCGAGVRLAACARGCWRARPVAGAAAGYDHSRT